MGEEAGSPFGRELRARRRDAGLSQEALAARSGLSVDAVAALERGRRRRPRAHTVRALSEALELTPAARRRLLAAADGNPATPGGLPGLPRPLVGRERERAELLELLGGAARVVTLTGPGGVGKTRLALSVAYTLAESWREAVYWVWLDPVADAAVLRHTVAAALGIRDAAGNDLTESLCARTAGRSALLVLDNCEQVVRPVARLCRDLVRAVPDLRVLNTSREALRTPGEVAYRVDPLAMPEEGSGAGPPSPATLRDWPATRLFLDRSRESTHDLQVDPATATAIATLCRRLDGLPLAIELAAAQLGRVPLERLLANLPASLGSGGPVTPSERHATMDAAIGWSYDLLDGAERTVFARLSVASGGWTMEAARAFAAGGPVSPDDVPDAVARLAHKSLVVRRGRPKLGRYTMLQVIGRHAAGRLEETGEADIVRERHARYYSGLADRASEHLRAPDQRTWLERLALEVGNLRVALAHWQQVGDTDAALRTATALWRFSYLRGRYAEGRSRLNAALVLARERPPSEPARLGAALVAAGTLAYLQCEYDAAGPQLAEGLATFRSLHDAPGTADALHRLGSIARERADYARATTLHTEALGLSRTGGEPHAVGEALNYLAFVAWLSGDLAGSAALAAQALDCHRGIDTGEGMVWAQLHLAITARLRGALDEAEARLQEALDRSEEIGYVEGTAWALDQLAEVARPRGGVELAWDLQHESLVLHAQLGDRWRAASVLEGLATSAVAGSRFETAARLCTTGQALRAQIGTPRPPCEAAAFARALAEARAALDPDAYLQATAAPRPDRTLQSLIELRDVEAALVR